MTQQMAQLFYIYAAAMRHVACMRQYNLYNYFKTTTVDMSNT